MNYLIANLNVHYAERIANALSLRELEMNRVAGGTYDIIMKPSAWRNFHLSADEDGIIVTYYYRQNEPRCIFVPSKHFSYCKIM